MRDPSSREIVAHRSSVGAKVRKRQQRQVTDSLYIDLIDRSSKAVRYPLGWNGLRTSQRRRTFNTHMKVLVFIHIQLNVYR